MSGLFISLEGVEGSGKSTHARILAETLRARDIKVILTREPGGTAIGDNIRDVLLSVSHGGMDPVTELLLYAAARRQHLKEVILPALEAGKVVLTDRFSDSTRAYQGHARELDSALIGALDAIATGRIKPNLTLLLDIDVREGLTRNRNALKLDRLELESLEFHEKVREGFLAIQRAEPLRVKLISAGGTIEQVQAQVMAEVEEALIRAGIE